MTTQLPKGVYAIYAGVIIAITVQSISLAYYDPREQLMLTALPVLVVLIYLLFNAKGVQALHGLFFLPVASAAALIFGKAELPPTVLASIIIMLGTWVGITIYRRESEEFQVYLKENNQTGE